MKTIAIVGAGPLLGLALARTFGRNGFRAALMARRREALDGYVETLAAEGVEARGFVADVMDPAAIARAFAEVRRTTGPVDVMEYSPIAMSFVPPSQVTAETARAAFEFMLVGAVNATREVLPHLLEQGDGALLYTTGRSALLPMKLLGSLGLGASALRHYAYSLNEELGPKGIYAGTVAMFSQVTPEAAQAMANLYWDMYQRRDRVEEIYGEGSAIEPAREISRIAQTHAPFDLPVPAH